MSSNQLAARAVSVVMAAMVVSVAAATAAGFWLSYGGLHAFAWKAGWRGPESWAWPATVDLFTVAGECGAMVSYLLRRRSVEAWFYLVAGFGASAVFNVLHAAPGPMWWAPYVVAAVPPVAAMAALAALLRVAYVVASIKAAEATPEAVPEADPAKSGERAYAAALKASIRAAPPAVPEAAPRPRRRATRRPAPRTRAIGLEAVRRAAEKAMLDGLPVPSARELARTYHVARDRAGEVRMAVLAGSNGHGADG